MPSATATAVLPTSTGTEGKEKPKKSKKPKMSKMSKKKRIIMLVALLLLGVGGFVGKGMLAGPAAPVPDPRTVPGSVVTLTSMTLNLSDGRYLKMTMALQLSKAASPAASADPAVTTTSFNGAKALDSAISVLGQRTYAQLIAPGGRSASQRVLSAEVKKRYDGDVLQVYFTEFLMQ